MDKSKLDCGHKFIYTSATSMFVGFTCEAYNCESSSHVSIMGSLGPHSPNFHSSLVRELHYVQQEPGQVQKKVL